MAAQQRGTSKQHSAHEVYPRRDISAHTHDIGYSYRAAPLSAVSTERN